MVMSLIPLGISTTPILLDAAIRCPPVYIAFFLVFKKHLQKRKS